MTATQNDLVDHIIAYEQGELSDLETLHLFAALIADGSVWSLQGSYGRAAKSLIESGLITQSGDITEYGHAAVGDD